MDAASSSSSSHRSRQPNVTSACASTVPSNPLIRKKKKKAVVKDAPSSSSCSASSSFHKGTRLSSKRRPLRVRFGSVRQPEVRDVDSVALPLGMSFAAVVAQVLEKTEVKNESLPPDYLSVICTSAVRESLANVFGDKFDCFVRNFEKSFGSTLRTLRLINDSSKNKEKYLSNLNNTKSSTSDETTSRNRCYRNSYDAKDSYSGIDLPSVSTRDQLNIHEDVQENVLNGSLNREFSIHGQINQLVCVNPRTGSDSNQSMVSSIEKSVIEQVRSNDLKTLELSLTMRKMKLKEEQLALNFDSNHLERAKLAMGISKASFKAEKFKNQLEDTRHAELLRMCIDFLVAELFIMSFLLMYGAYVYSYKRITDATSSCSSSELHTKKRNRLAQSRLNDMVFVKFNRALERRAKSKETDPILLQDIDESNEWLMIRMEDDEDDDEAMFVGEDLTWSDVANASGAYESSYLTRASKVMNDGAGPSRNDKGKSPAHNPISSRQSRRCLVDEDEMEEDIGVSSDEGDGKQVLVDPKAGVIFQFRVPHSQVPGSSCKQDDLWSHADSCCSYLLIQRSGTSKQMPVTFILLLLGIACGLAGKSV
ncbi:hypothetical protein F3Y22_tig00110160pilonHSYRG00705 [Hibiscus syriacus]|uniref:Uncharacterized protein n=1 Tax=Hibiscus syriacus TaxID=106335 RepID=A0A6A3BIG8_HIBSY|nr:hypothetical protein F3Y22_tig00110160pilonHSYRG00705 [Hibiscus syriacus]